jgi:hypothetical protein
MKNPLYQILGISLLLNASISNAVEVSAITSLPRNSSPYVDFEVAGSGFGDGPNIVLFDDFSTGAAGLPVDLTLPVIGQWSASSDYSGVPIIVEQDNSKAMNIHDFGKESLNRIAQLEVVFPEKVNDIFLSYNVIVPSNRYFAGASEDVVFPGVSSWKFTWIADGIGAIGSQTRFNLCIPTHAGNGSFMLQGNSGGLGYVNVQDNWSWHGKNHFSFGQIPDNDSPTTNNGKVFWSHTSSKGNFSKFTADQPVMPSGVTTSFDRVKFPGWFGNGDYSNFDAYYDDIYVAVGDNALARAVLTDSLNPEDASLNITLPVTSWSQEKIVVKINKEYLLSDSSPRYLRVYDANNNSSAKQVSLKGVARPPSNFGGTLN